MEEKKKSFVGVGIALFALGAALGAGCYFGYDNYLAKDEKAENSGSTSTEITEKKDNNTVSSKDLVATKYEKDGYYYSPHTYGSMFSYTIDGSDLKHIQINYSQEYVNMNYKPYGVTVDKNGTLEKTFDKPVLDIISAGFGQAAGPDDAFAVLFQDGTVSYLKVVDAFNSAEAKEGKLPDFKVMSGFENVLQIKQVNIWAPKSTGSGGCIALFNDGTFKPLEIK